MARQSARLAGIGQPHGRSGRARASDAGDGRRAIGVLTAQWQAVDADPDGTLLAEVVADPLTLDAFDRVQLAAVIRTCRQSSSLSAAGRTLFTASRAERVSTNDADRLRKYLARFGLDWTAVAASQVL